MDKKIFLSALCLAIFVSGAWSNPVDKPKQKVFLFLNEPLRDEESVVIRLNNETEKSADLPSQGPGSQLDKQELFQIIYQTKKQGQKKEILVDLIHGGLVVLDVYDFYGKKLGNLFTGYQGSGLLVLDESEEWKVFNRFKGIVYFTLTVDGRVVTKKLVAKVD